MDISRALKRRSPLSDTSRQIWHLIQLKLFTNQCSLVSCLFN